MTDLLDDEFDPEDDLDDCDCEFPDSCGGTHLLVCEGCGGDTCVCDCGGEQVCPGCDDCLDDDEFEDDDEFDDDEDPL